VLVHGKDGEDNMPINNLGQYTFGVPQNNGYYSSGYGSMGNPYIVGGPGYTGAMNNTGGGSLTGGLLSNSAKVQSNPGFDDSSGLPIHTSHVIKQDGTPEMTSSFYFNQAQKPGQSPKEWDAMNRFEKAQIHENAARLAVEAGDVYSARRSMDVAERLRTETPDWANPKGGYKGLAPWNYGDEGEFVAPGVGDYEIIPGDQRGLLSNIDQESISNIFDWINPLGILSKADDINIPDLITNFVQSKFNANKQSTPAQVTAPVANAFNPYAGYEAAPAPANNEDGYGGYANEAAHTAAQSVLNSEEKNADGEYWYI